jgi:formamidopyrimidine-DNA glycosylase
MPELPEVQTIVDGLTRLLLERRIESVTVLRPSSIRGDIPAFRQRLEGKTIGEIQRRGKYILFRLKPEGWLIAHLKMTGKFTLQPVAQMPGAYDRVVLTLADDWKLVFFDIRGFGRLEGVDDPSGHAALSRLGWDPWDERLTPLSLTRRLKTRKAAIKTALLDQTIIAGLGNIYASEVLFDARIHPGLSACDLSGRQAKVLIGAIRKILRQALRYNGTTISDYRRVDEKQGGFQEFLKVYGRKGQPCRHCSTDIIRIVQNQRSTFLCPICQQNAAFDLSIDA